MTIIAPQSNLFVLLAYLLVAVGCRQSEQTSGRALTSTEISQAVYSMWGLEWSAKKCIDADVVAFIENMHCDVCIRLSCERASGDWLVDQILVGLSETVLVLKETNNAEERLQIDYVLGNIRQFEIPAWTVANCTHFAFKGNKYLSWYIDDHGITVYLLHRGLRQDQPEVVALFTGGNQVATSDSFLIPPRIKRIERLGLLR